MDEGQSNAITYRSAVDVWIVALLLGVVLVPLYEGGRLLWAGDELGWLVIVVWGFGILPVLLVCWPCRYTLTDQNVIIQCGVANIIEHEIAYKEIERVSRFPELPGGPGLVAEARRLYRGVESPSGTSEGTVKVGSFEEQSFTESRAGFIQQSFLK